MAFINTDEFWNMFLETNKDEFEELCKYILLEFGTTLSCNRFDIGNCIEYALADMIGTMDDIQVDRLPNAVRFDININNYGSLSIKYTSSGDIRVHNSLGGNHDMTMKDTMIITPRKMYFITMSKLEEMGIHIKEYLVDNKDALCLKRKLLKELDKIKYPYTRVIDIEISKKDCKHQQCSVVFYNHVKQQIMKNKEQSLDALEISLSSLNISDV